MSVLSLAGGQAVEPEAPPRPEELGLPVLEVFVRRSAETGGYEQQAAALYAPEAALAEVVADAAGEGVADTIAQMIASGELHAGELLCSLCPCLQGLRRVQGCAQRRAARCAAALDALHAGPRTAPPACLPACPPACLPAALTLSRLPAPCRAPNQRSLPAWRRQRSQRGARHAARRLRLCDH